jgi:hypothetical protein
MAARDASAAWARVDAARAVELAERQRGRRGRGVEDGLPEQIAGGYERTPFPR